MFISKVVKLVWRCFLLGFVLPVALYCLMSLYPVSQDNAEAVLDLVKDNVVKVQPEAPVGGTGFIIELENGDKRVLTNAHICSLVVFGQLFAVGESTETTSAITIDYEDSSKELCLLKFSLLDTDLDLKNLGLRVRSEGPSIAEKIYTVGYPGLGPLTVSAGRVITPNIFLNIWAYITNAKAKPGCSGSPVVDGEGALVGVVFATDMFDNMLMIHYNEIKEFLEDAMQATKEEEEDNADLQ